MIRHENHVIRDGNICLYRFWIVTVACSN